jgi:uncharacterized lipoprotein
MLFIVAVTVLTVGCSRDKTLNCGSGTAYLEAESAGLLRVPEGLTAPDQTEALNIPGPAPSRETDEDTPACLEYSPAFSARD